MRSVASRHEERGASTARPARVGERTPRSLPARYPPGGCWPVEMRADVAAAFLDYATTGKLLKAVLRGEAPRPTATRARDGRREPVWAQDALRAHVASRHNLGSDAVSEGDSIASLI